MFDTQTIQKETQTGRDLFCHESFSNMFSLPVVLGLSHQTVNSQNYIHTHTQKKQKEKKTCESAHGVNAPVHRRKNFWDRNDSIS